MQRTNSTWVIVAVIVAVVFLVLVFGGVGMMGFGGMWPGMMGGYGYRYGYGVNLWWGALMMVFWVLVIAGIVALVVWAIREKQPSPTGRVRESEALEILKQRYARGEITREEYERMRQDLL